MNLELHSNRFLVCRPDRLGDVTLSTPFASVLKNAFPESEVYYLVREQTAAVFENNPYVDKILFFESKNKKSETIFTLAKQLRPLGITHAFQLIPNEQITYAMFLAGIPYRSGVGNKLFQFLTNTKSVYRRKYEQSRNEGDYCLDHLRKIGIPVENPLPRIYLSDAEKNIIAEKKAALGTGKKAIVGVHVTSGNSAPNLKPEEYQLLLEKLSGYGDLAVVNTDLEKVSGMKDLPEVAYINRGTTLRESILNYAALDWLISASTGPMHVSAALGVRTLSLFCPLPACQPALWGPMNPAARFILPDEGYCGRECPGDPHICTFSGKGGIDGERVADILRQQIV
ncbi:MAG: lipopolysaccharide heptosyltransferase family protein [Ignavibacteriaceae bacterium]|nr:lipopolysaccharide heptosyltransferase family protein [Ignavibacteriaceae bacterium]